ncbi:MAG: hypothetical protein J5922_03955, partial [Clostridia bacterium]|nr:hypothetical protein [Clostridia bacterium]
MKKFVCVFVAFLSLSLFSCRGTSKKDYYSSEFRENFDIKVQISDFDFGGSVSYSSKDDFEISLSYPENLCGLKIVCKNSEYFLQNGDMEIAIKNTPRFLTLFNTAPNENFTFSKEKTQFGKIAKFTNGKTVLYYDTIGTFPL